MGRIARFPKFVVDILKACLLVVAFDREDLLEHGFQSVFLAFIEVRLILQEGFIAGRLNLGEIRGDVGLTSGTKTTFLGRIQASLYCDSHRPCCSRVKACGVRLGASSWSIERETQRWCWVKQWVAAGSGKHWFK